MCAPSRRARMIPTVASGAARLMRRLSLAIALCAFVAPAGADAATLPPIKHVFVVIEENESASTTFATSSPAPYLSTTLVSEGAYLPNYYGIGHSSLDNYIAMVSGQAPNPLTSGDCQNFVDFPADSIDSSGQENGEGCVYPADVPSLMSQLDAAGLTWRAYEDGMGADPTRESATCGHPTVGEPDNTEGATATDQYATRHDPFVYFHYVIDNASECNADVVNLSRLTTDLQSVTTTPNYVFVTPDLCNDGHDSGGECTPQGGGGLAQADSFLRTLVPEITSSPAFQQDGLLIITFDEAEGGDDSACCGEMPGPFDAANGIQPGGGGPGGGVVGAVLLSPFIAPGTVTTTSYNHYSMLASVEDLFGLPRIGDAVGVTSFGSDIFTRPPAPTPVPPTPTPTPTPVPVGPVVPNGPSIGAAQLRLAISKEITPSGAAAKIAALVKKRGFSLRFNALEAGKAVVQWFEVPRGATIAKAGRKTHAPILVASGKAVFQAAGTQTIVLALTGAGRRLLGKAKRQTLTAEGTFTPSGGATPVSARKTFVLH